MYGLFRNTYDYYEWHDLVAVSAVKENLIKRFEAEGSNYPLLEGGAQEAAADNEDAHYEICDVEEI